MKFLRKVLAICLAIVFLIAVIIGAGIILSVQNVNVRFVYYGENAHAADYAETRVNLEKLKGSGLLFIGEDDIEGKVINGEALAVESYKKVFPCSLDIVIRERAETFAVTAQGSLAYNVYDERGVLMRANAATCNGTDGCPNVLVSGFSDADMVELAEICDFFKQAFSSFRRIVESVSVTKVAENQALAFTLRSGFVIRVHGYKGAQDNKLKIEKAYEKYSSLTDNQKLEGVIDVIGGKDGGDPFVIYPGYTGI